MKILVHKSPRSPTSSVGATPVGRQKKSVSNNVIETGMSINTNNGKHNHRKSEDSKEEDNASSSNDNSDSESSRSTSSDDQRDDASSNESDTEGKDNAPVSTKKTKSKQPRIEKAADSPVSAQVTTKAKLVDYYFPI